MKFSPPNSLMLTCSSSKLTVFMQAVGLCSVAGVMHTTLKLLTSWLKVQRMRKILADVPLARYENPSGFLGYSKAFLKNLLRLNDWFDEITKGSGVSKMFGVRFEPQQVWLIVHDPACINHFLKDAAHLYTKPSDDKFLMMKFVRMWIGDGIFTFQHGVGAPDKGKSWLTQRKIAANIFSKANFQRNMGEVFTEKARRLVMLLQIPASRGECVDIQRLFFAFTMDSIMRIFFNEDVDTMDGTECTYGSAFDEAHRSMIAYLRPSAAFLQLLSYLPWPLGGTNGLAIELHGKYNLHFQNFQRAIETLTKESDRLVTACRNDPNLAERKDLLALFVQAEEEHFTDKYLRDMVLNFIIAGRDTTACLLSWMLYVLCMNPEVQANLIAEIDEKQVREAPTLKSLSASAMPYLHGVLYEVLRLYPPVPRDNKVAMADDTFPDGTRIPKGTSCIWCPYCMGRDAARYPEPQAVKPERWIPFTAPAPHEFPVFQAGPRICLGIDMALFEAKLVAVMLLKEFSFDLKPGEAENISYATTLTMSICNSKKLDSHNLWVKPKRRVK